MMRLVFLSIVLGVALVLSSADAVRAQDGIPGVPRIGVPFALRHEKVGPPEKIPASRISVSDCHVLYHDSDMPFTMDQSFATLVRAPGSTIYFAHMSIVDNHPDYVLHYGPPSDPFQTRVVPLPSVGWTVLNGTPDPWNIWITNTYRVDANSFIGFCHLESDEEDPGLRKYELGIAYSTDWLTWKLVGKILSAQNEPMGKNVGGVPYIVKDGYFYVYYNDFDGPPGRRRRRPGQCESQAPCCGACPN
jgi:hypothetical protein